MLGIAVLVAASLLVTANANVDMDVLKQLPMFAVEATPGPMQYLNQSKHVVEEHSFHTNQALEMFSMRRILANAPWSARIQPAILPMYRKATYKNWFTGTTTSQASDWLILFEGSLGWRAGANRTAENDVWASGDDGETWDLIAGISEYGASNHTEAWGNQKQTFAARVGATNCEDPSSDVVYSIGGTTSNPNSDEVGTNEVWSSSDGLYWSRYYNTGLPTRFFASCDVDVSGHVYTMGGINLNKTTGKFTLLNDVWTNFRSDWQASTLIAPWSPRAEHLVLITENPKLGRDIIYVLGGMVDVEGAKNTNDVYASSDQGATWVKMPTPPWEPRWGHAGITTDAGVIVVMGGSSSLDGTFDTMYTYREVWVSFDGAMTWSSCRLPTGDDSKREYIRTEQGATLLTDGRLMLVSGQSFCPAGECQHQLYSYQDVWVTDWSLEDTGKLARMSGAKVPSYIGLSVWPSSTPVNPRSLFVMNPLTHNAPWSSRTEPALLRMANPIKYKQASTGLTVSTPANWMLMYEGSREWISWISGSALENDVWASGDEGKTWDVISGISYIYGEGVVNSSHPDSSFQGREFAANCEDPTNDDVYSIGGVHYDENWNKVASNLVQFSEDSQNWVIRTGQTFSPSRWLASCDVTSTGALILVGGVAYKTSGNKREYLLNDVWRATDQGKRWEYLGDAPFPARAETQVVIYTSETFDEDIIYVIGGYTKYDQWNDVYQTTNDIWASRDMGTSWDLINEAPSFTPRWGHAVLVTESGILMVAGGANSKTGKARDNLSLRDMHISLDGGYYWSTCRLPSGVDYIRVNQGAQLLEDNRVLFISGYTLHTGYQQRDYKDVFVSVSSIDDLEALAKMCVAVEIPVDASGEPELGLQVWPGEENPDEEDEEKESGLTKSAITLAIFFALAVVGYCGYQYKHTGKLPLPWGSSATSYAQMEAPSTDFSAFTFGDDAPSTTK